MLTATLALVLTGGFSPGVNVAIPNLHSDYAQARAAAQTSSKPMAVFIGHGSDAIGRMLAAGTITPDAAQLLRDSYVSLYLNTDTEAGKELASRFAMTEGLVISSPGGSVQAYRHSGTFSSEELTRQLTVYSTAGQPTRTVIAGAAAPSVSPVFVGGMVYPAGYTTGGVIISGGCANGSCGVPAGGYSIPSASIGGCANGRCPTPR